MIVYFSGTGNSRYCAQMMADQLGETLTDAFPYIRASKAANLQSDTPWVFVAPTYARQLPRRVCGLPATQQLFRQPGGVFRTDLRQRYRLRGRRHCKAVP